MTINGVNITMRSTGSGSPLERLTPASAMIGTLTAGDYITRRNVRWAFDRDVEYGGFVEMSDGFDYYVKFVTGLEIDSIQYWNGSSWVNGGATAGTMVNPIPDDADPGTQGLTNGYSYSAAKNITDSAAGGSLPYACSAGESIVSATPHTPGSNPLGRVNDLTYVNEIEVLTILADHPTVDAFRPGFHGTDKTIPAYKSDLSYALLGTNTLLGSEPSQATVEAIMANTWLPGMHRDPHMNRDSRPYVAMEDYGRDISAELSVVCAWLQMNYTDAQKENTALQLCQVGIDNYAAVVNGCQFYANGGQSSGFKTPIVMAGAMLGITAMRDTGTTYAFGEDVCEYVPSGWTSTYNYLSNSHSGTVTSGNAGTTLTDTGATFASIGSPNSGSATAPCPGQIIRNTTDGSSAILLSRTDNNNLAHTQLSGGTNNDWTGGDSYEIDDVGMPEWGYQGSVRYRQWYDDGTTGDELDYRAGSGCCTAAYWGGQLFAIMEMGLQSNWSNDATFDYMRRFNLINGQDGIESTFTDAVMNNLFDMTGYE